MNNIIATRKTLNQSPFNFWTQKHSAVLHKALEQTMSNNGLFRYVAEKLHLHHSLFQNAGQNGEFDKWLRFYGDVRARLNIEAGHVLYLCGGADVFSPFNFYHNTNEVTILALENFGTPMSLEKYFNRKRMKYSIESCCKGFENIRKLDWAISKYGGVGGELINRIILGLKATEINNINYFEVNESGEKIYLCGNDGQSFQNAEIVFTGNDSQKRVLRYISADLLNLDLGMRAYLQKLDFSHIHTRASMSVFEKSPTLVRFFVDILFDREILWTSDSTQVRGTGVKLPPAYIDPEKSKKLDLRELQSSKGLSRPLFGYGNHVYIASADSFRDSWPFEATHEYDKRKELIDSQKFGFGRLV